jgi:signal transduction histidine kinase
VDGSWIILLIVVGLLAAVALAGTIVRMIAQRQRGAEHRDGERRLALECTLLRNAVESIGDGLAAFDQSGHLVLSNARFLDLLDLRGGGRTPTSLQELLMRQALRGDFGDGQPAVQVHDRTEAFYRDAAVMVERFAVGARIVQVQRRPVLGGMVVALYSDITERKAAENRLTQAWAEAELGNRAKSEFLANMSHELRTPLNAIIGFSEVIASQMLGPIEEPKYLEYIHDIHGSGMHLLAIVNDVLDMSKIEAGKLELRPAPIEVSAMVAESIRMVEERAHDRGIEIRAATEIDGVVVADARAIKQIALNLLSNAVKFSRENGEIAVRARVANDGSFVLEVEDHGIGMTAEGIKQALQPFGQVHEPSTRTQSGTGLGLPITKGLVEAHGGTLVIESRPGHGTIVRVTLPPDSRGASAQSRAVLPAPKLVTEHGQRTDRAVA